MKTYKYTIAGQPLTIRIKAGSGQVAEIAYNGQTPEVDAANMPAYAAAISLALLESDIEVVHDDEPDVITLSQSKSRWSNPAEAMTERGSLLKPLLGW